MLAFHNILLVSASFWWCVRRFRFNVPKGNAAIINIVRRKLKRDFIARQNANMVFLHFATSVSHQFVAIF